MSTSVSFFVCDGFQLLDLAGPLAALGSANRLLDDEYYRVSVISDGGGFVPGDATVGLKTQSAEANVADTVVVVGGLIDSMKDPANVKAIQHVAASALRVASICTGAFLLAEAGLLDNRRATTHWQFAQMLQHGHPQVKVDADRIFINDGPIWTSAGMTAGIDLMLACIEIDHGPELAKSVSRDLVVYHRRPGGQSQFAAIAQMEPLTDRVRRALTFARDHLSEPLAIERLAGAACLSVRQFARLFKQETGETPARAIERLRCEAARTRLREGNEPISVVAQAVGFADAGHMRSAFLRTYGHPPQMQRKLDQPLTAQNDGYLTWPPSGA